MQSSFISRGMIAAVVVGATQVVGGVASAQPQPEPPKTPPRPIEPPAPSSTDVPISGPQLISVTHVTIAVPDRAAAMESLIRIALRAGGQPPARTADHADLRVPRQRLEQVLDELRELGSELHRQAEVQDVSGELSDLASEIANTRATRKRVLSLRARAKDVDESLLVETQMSKLDSRLAELEFERNSLQRQVDLATIHVQLVFEAEAPPEHLPRLQLPFYWLGRTGLKSLLNPEEKEDTSSLGELQSMIDGGIQGEFLALDGLEGHSNAVVGGGAIRMRALAPGGLIKPAIGFDVGFAGGEGHAYDLDFLLGVGAAPARWMTLGLVSGAAGRSWSGGRIPAAWEIPAELFVTFEMSDWGRLLLQARPQWIAPRIEDRHDGSNIEFADEFVFRSTLMLAPLVGHSDMNDGALRLGFVYHEVRDAQVWGASLGWGAGLVEIY